MTTTRLVAASLGNPGRMLLLDRAAPLPYPAAMSRIARVVVPGVPMHILRWGNREQPVFFGDEDRTQFLELLGRYAAEAGLKVHAYCLMGNHFHLVATPKTAKSLSAALGPAGIVYTQQVNRRLGVTGQLWAGRPQSCPLDQRHFHAAVRFVERNPIRARLVRKAHRYRWSSAPAHCGLVDDPLLTGGLALPEGVADWSEFLAQPGVPEEVERIRTCTRTGRPAGDERFIKRMERRTGRMLHARPVGRPPKKKTRSRK